MSYGVGREGGGEDVRPSPRWGRDPLSNEVAGHYGLAGALGLPSANNDSHA